MGYKSSLKLVDLEFDKIGAYLSLDYSPHFGWGECPHVMYEGNVQVKDNEGNVVENATVIGSTGQGVTDAKGQVRLNLNIGKQNLYIQKDGELYSVEVNLPEDTEKTVGLLTVHINPDAYQKLSDSSYVDNVYTVAYSSGNGSKWVSYAALTRDGSLYMWGGNHNGQIGTGTTEYQNEPVRILENVKEFQFDSLGTISAALTKDGSLYMWGTDSCGRLGNGLIGSKQLTPYEVVFPENNTKVKQFFFCNRDSDCAAITLDGKLYLWGNNDCDQINSSETLYVAVPVLLLTAVEKFAMYEGTCAAIQNTGALWLWGNNNYCRAGKKYFRWDTQPPLSIAPEEAVHILDSVKEVYIGDRDCFAIKEDGTLWAWGYDYGSTVSDKNEEILIPQENILPEERFSKVVAVGASIKFFVTQDGNLYQRISADSHDLSLVDGVSNVVEVYGEQGTYAVLTKSGNLYLWGSNKAGQLGNGTSNSIGANNTPTQVLADMQVLTFQFLFDGRLCAATVKGNSATLTKDLYMWGSYSGEESSGVFYAGSYEYTPQLKASNIRKLIPYPNLIYSNNGTGSTVNTGLAVIKEDGTVWEWFASKEGSQREELTEKMKLIASSAYASNYLAYRFMVASDAKGSLYSWKASGKAEKWYLFGDKSVMKKLAGTGGTSVLEAETIEGSVLSETSDAQNSVQNVIDSDTRTVDFANLLADEIYNVYAVKSRNAENVLDADNLLYIGQAVSGSDGSLHVEISMRESFAEPHIFCVSMRRTDLSEADVKVKGIIYDGLQHVPQVTVTCDGKVLREDIDYKAYYAEYVIETGEYELTIKGIGAYGGEKKVTFSVVDRGDILMEDTPEDGKIPNGLWIAGIRKEGYDYTGSAVKPDIRVYDGKVLLQEQVDYTISYKNNVGASTSSAAGKQPTLTVTGKGNYTGKDTQTFTILPVDISSPLFAAESITVTYNAKDQKPIPTLYWNGKQLKNKSDFTYSYYKESTDGTGNIQLDSVKEEGSYYVKLSGNGNFTGSRIVKLTVLPAATDSTSLKPINKVTVARIPNQSYVMTNQDGIVRPEITVMDGKTVLTKDVHYTVSYSNNNKVGTAFVIIEGREEAGYSGVKRIAFQITGTAISKAKVNGLNSQTFVYNGDNQKPELSLTMKLDGVERTLEEDKDYTVQWQKNQNAGTATVIFTGKNGYIGTLKRTFRIQAFNIEVNAEGRFEATIVENEVPYAKGGTKPKLSVTFKTENGEIQTLREGVDYTVTYKNNNALNDGSNPNKIPMLILKGKGNFAGNYGELLTYKIVKQDIGKLTLTATDKVYQNKGNVYTTKVTITDVDGKVLKAGTDYEKDLIYMYKEDTILENGTVRRAGDTIDKADIIPAGTIICVTAIPKGNYTGTSLSGEYCIKTYDISGASVTIPAQIYTGNAIILDKSDPKQIVVKVKGKVVDPSQFEIVNYQNNVAKGTATVTIKGKDNYGGMKKVTFKIKAKSILWWWRW